MKKRFFILLAFFVNNRTKKGPPAKRGTKREEEKERGKERERDKSKGKGKGKGKGKRTGKRERVREKYTPPFWRTIIDHKRAFS
jgi:hypothetical protein